MNIIIKDADTFKKIISCLKDLITDSANIILDSEGLHIQSTDTTNVVMIDLFMNEDAFIKYELGNQDEIKLGIDFLNLNDILKLSKSNQICMIYKLESDKLTLKLNENNKKIQFNMSLSNVDKEQLEVQDIKYEASVYCDVNDFQKYVKDISSFGKKCEIKLNKNELILSINGDIGDGYVCIDDLEINYHDSKNENEIYGGMYNIKYLNNIIKTGLSNELIINFAKDIPTCFEYQLEYGHIKFYLSQLVD